MPSRQPRVRSCSLLVLVLSLVLPIEWPRDAELNLYSREQLSFANRAAFKALLVARGGIASLAHAEQQRDQPLCREPGLPHGWLDFVPQRSEEHTSELQSP